MGIAMRALDAGIQAAGRPGPLDDFWYQPTAGPTASGVRVTEALALNLSTVRRCVEINSGALATTPLQVFRSLGDDGGKEAARAHPMYRKLHTQPNPLQKSDVWREQMGAYLMLRGNSYNRIVESGPLGTYDLVPINPSRVEMRIAFNGLPVYGERSNNGTIDRWLNRQEMLHIPGLTLSNDGITGLGTIQAAGETIGLALSAEKFGAKVFGKGIHPSFVLEHPNQLGDTNQERMRANFRALYGGEDGWQNLAIFEEGMKLVSVPYGLTPADAQLLSVRAYETRELCRWFGVPPHMVGETEKVTSWGSGIEQLSIGWVVWTMLRWFTRIEKALSEVILGEDFFAQFNVNGLLRGDTKSRYDSYRVGLEWGFMTINEVRRLEGLNPIAGGDVPTVQMNRQQLAQMGQQMGELKALLEARPEAAYSLPADASSREMLELFAGGAAARVVRKEVEAMSRAAKASANDAAAWAEGVRSFYAKHPPYVMELLPNLGAEQAERYCAEQRDTLLQDGAGAMRDWEPNRVEALVEIAIGAGGEPRSGQAETHWQRTKILHEHGRISEIWKER